MLDGLPLDFRLTATAARVSSVMTAGHNRALLDAHANKIV